MDADHDASADGDKMVVSIFPDFCSSSYTPLEYTPSHGIHGRFKDYGDWWEFVGAVELRGDGTVIGETYEPLYDAEGDEPDPTSRRVPFTRKEIWGEWEIDDDGTRLSFAKDPRSKPQSLQRYRIGTYLRNKGKDPTGRYTGVWQTDSKPVHISGLGTFPLEPHAGMDGDEVEAELFPLATTVSTVDDVRKERENWQTILSSY